MRRVRVPVIATLVLIVVGAVVTLGITYWLMSNGFVAGDAHALDGIVRVPVNEPFVFINVRVWDGRGGPVQRSRSVVVRDGRVESIRDAAGPLPAGVRQIDASWQDPHPRLHRVVVRSRRVGVDAARQAWGLASGLHRAVASSLTAPGDPDSPLRQCGFAKTSNSLTTACFQAS